MGVTNPATTPQIDPWDAFAKVLGDTSAGRASGRQAQALFNLQRDQLANQQYGQTSQNTTAGNNLAGSMFGQESNNALNQAKFGLEAPGVRGRQAVQGDILANAQDASITGLPDRIHVPTVSGGLRPSLFSADTRELGRTMSHDALTATQAGDGIKYPTAPTPTSYGAPPPLTPVPTAGALDSILNTGSSVAGIIGALSKLAGGSGGQSGGDLGKIVNAIKKLFSRGGGTTTGMPASNPNWWEDLGETVDPWGNPAPQGTVDTDEWLGPWPETNGNQGTGGIDPNQLPGHVDPMMEYWAWLANQGGGGGEDDGEWWDEG